MKVMKKIITAALTLALAVVTMLGMTPTSTVSADTTEVVHTAAINIEKFLQGVNGNVPNVTNFQWKIEPISYQPASSGQTPLSQEEMPDVIGVVQGKGTISQTTDGSGVTTAKIETGVDRLADPTGQLVGKDFTGSVYFTFANNQPIGVYTYKISEINPDDPTNPSNQGVIYDTDGYYINVYVINEVDNDGAPTGTTSIANITAWKTTNTGNNDGNTSDVTGTPNFDGTSSGNPNQTENTTPGTDQNAENTDTLNGNTKPAGKTAITTTPGDFNGGRALVLTSPYTNGFETYDLEVGKNVVGNYASTDDEFTFEVQLADSAYAAGDKLTVLDGNGNPLKDATGNQVYYIMGQTNTFTLKHGETFKIEGLSSVASYIVKEANTNNYYTPAAVYTAGHGATPSAVQDNTSAAVDTSLNYTEASNLVSPLATKYNVPILGTDQIDTTKQNVALQVSGTIKTKYDVSVPGPSTESQVVKQEGTVEDVTIMYTNFKDYVTPTGMLMNVLPYAVGVIAVAAVAVVVVMKKRKEGYAESSNSQGL